MLMKRRITYFNEKIDSMLTSFIFMILNVMSEINIISLIQIDIKKKNREVGFQFEM